MTTLLTKTHKTSTNSSFRAGLGPSPIPRRYSQPPKRTGLHIQLFMQCFHTLNSGYTSILAYTPIAGVHYSYTHVPATVQPIHLDLYTQPINLHTDLRIYAMRHTRFGILRAFNPIAKHWHDTCRGSQAGGTWGYPTPLESAGCAAAGRGRSPLVNLVPS